MNATAVLTPYLIPPELGGRKAVNIGDGFILHAIERLAGRFPAGATFSPRVAPPPSVMKVLAESRYIVLAGANQLNDAYTIWPGLTAELVRAGHFRFLPFGVGINGEPARTRKMSEATRAILAVMHERIAFSSWRCPLTLAYLEREMPELREKILMTGCPVIYDAPLLDGHRFGDRDDAIAVTITDRGDDWWTREAATLDFVADHFPKSRRALVLHQDFAALRQPKDPGNPTLLQSQTISIRRHAERLGYEIVIPGTAEEAARRYRTMDMHFGSRVHAHLYFLSQNKRSFLTEVDDRSIGMARALGFALCQPRRFRDYLDFDFEIIRKNARNGFLAVKMFLQSLV